jgi:hypothetical protein
MVDKTSKKKETKAIIQRIAHARATAEARCGQDRSYSQVAIIYSAHQFKVV